MMKLYGTRNYFSTAKGVYRERRSFEESVFPSQEPEVIDAPWGRRILIDGKILTETNVIFDYLEDIKPQPALTPPNPGRRRK